MSTKIQSFEEILDRAFRESREAVDAVIAKSRRDYPDRHPDHLGACGFAWVEVALGRHPFTSYCAFRKQGKRQDYKPRAWMFWNPSGYAGQRMDVKEAGAVAFARVLKDAGLPASARSRLD